MSNLLDRNDKNVLENAVHYFDMGIELTDVILSEPNVQKLMASNHTFDAVICEVFLSEALYGLSEHFKAPLIGLGTFGAISWNTDMVKNTFANGVIVQIFNYFYFFYSRWVHPLPLHIYLIPC